MSLQAIKSDKSIGFIFSFCLHLLMLTAGGFAFAKPAQYAVEIGTGGVEIQLVAAPALASAMEPQKQETPLPKEKAPLLPDPEDLLMPEEPLKKEAPAAISEPEKKEAPKDILTAFATSSIGDGSSKAAGKDATTFYSSGGALMEYKPDYLKNPAPYYPWEARQKGWEGVVVLKVMVDKTGHPIKIDKEQSSGHSVLDDSALKTVKRWRFRPAQLGSLPVESLVRIPIRFELESA